MIRLIEPFVTYEEVEPHLRKIFANRWFTRGEYVAGFRDALKAYLNVSVCHLVTSATAGLWVAMRMLEVKEGDKVLVADYSFPATVNVIEDVGATPVFVDIDPETYNMSLTDLRAKLQMKPKAVIFVDTFGNPSGLLEIASACKEAGVPLIEDAACAIGSSVEGAKCGSIADITCFSFHPRKLLTTGEGGAITTTDPKWDKWLTEKLLHGAVPAENGLSFVTYGYNFRMTEMQAAMGCVQVPKLDEIVTERQAIFNQYEVKLRPLGFKAQTVAAGCVSSRQSAVFRVPEGVNRDQLIKKLATAGIETTIGTYCQSVQPYYLHKYNALQTNSLKVFESALTFPCYLGVPLDNVVEAVGNALTDMGVR